MMHIEKTMRFVDKKFNFYIVSWIPIFLKSFVILICLGSNLTIRKTLCPIVDDMIYSCPFHKYADISNAL